MTKTLRYTMRYSPKPMEAYKVSTALLDTPERWNLAYLSHDYDKQPHHKDPQFAVNVRRTTQMRLDGKGLDLVGEFPLSQLVGSLFILPAPRAVHRLLAFESGVPLPMFQAYGNKWVDTMMTRSKQCWYDDQGLEPEPVTLTSIGIRYSDSVLAKMRQPAK